MSDDRAQPVVEMTRVAGEVVAAARAVEGTGDFPRRYVERVRAATAWLSADGAGARGDGDVRHAALLLSRQAAVDLEPPMAARGTIRRLVKYAVRRLVGWYVRFLGQQVAAIGQATARLGVAVAARVERIEAEQESERAALEREVQALRDRVARLEARLAERTTE